MLVPFPGFSLSQHLNRKGVSSPWEAATQVSEMASCLSWLHNRRPGATRTPSAPAPAGLRPVPPALGTDRVNIAYGHPAREGSLGDRVASFKPPARSQLWLKISPPWETCAAGMAGPCIKHGPVGFPPLNGFIQSTRGERVMGGITWLPGGTEQPRPPPGPPASPPCAWHPGPRGTPHSGRPGVGWLGAAPCSQNPPRPFSGSP